MPRATIINYGVGNLFSIKCSLERNGFTTTLCSSISPSLRDADAIILPGVGNFRAIENMRDIIDELIGIIRGGVPTLGICLGMQILLDESEESFCRGLGIIHGKVVRLPSSVKIPHIGWNNLEIINPLEILDDVNEGDYFYFAHSYYPMPSSRDVIVAETEYGVRFTSVIAYRNIFGVQFHPEKSGRAGEKIIRNFLRIIKQ
ncbi:MAG: imidazole glycerol phosphate synthase subunit HisH [Candidatus Bathyarchaeia archaeon]